jgi:hypothetical protein
MWLRTPPTREHLTATVLYRIAQWKMPPAKVWLRSLVFLSLTHAWAAFFQWETRTFVSTPFP